MLYHVSRSAGLKTLLPQTSSHGKAYVYAVDRLATGLLFGAPQDDFDLYIDNEPDGTPLVRECYPGAFEAVYRNKSCSVYEVSEQGFIKGATGWDAEYVCPEAVAVLAERPVPDLFAALEAEREKGSLVICRYSEAPAYKKLISEHIADRLIRFDALSRLETDERFQKHYKALVLALRDAMDGHLL